MNRVLKGYKGVAALSLTVLLAGFALVAESATLKLATVAPEGSQWMTSMRAAASEIKERTSGRVVIKLYGGGVMGAEKSMLRKMRIGQLQGGAFVASGLAPVYPAINIYSLPLVFRSLAEVEYVRARMDERLIRGMEEQGFISFGFAGGGFANIYSNIPVRSLDDLKGQKVWVPEGDTIGYEAMRAFGLSPVTLPLTDVMTGLQTGLIDIVATSPVGAVVFQWYTKVKYTTQLPVVYVFATMIVDAKAFNKLDAEDQAVVREVMTRTYKEFDEQSTPDNAGAYEALLANGIQPVVPGDAAVASLWEKGSEVARSLAEKQVVDPVAYKEVDALLKTFRSLPDGTQQTASSVSKPDR